MQTKIVLLCGLLFLSGMLYAQDPDFSAPNDSILFLQPAESNIPPTDPYKILRWVTLGTGNIRYKGDLGNGYLTASPVLSIGLRFNKKKRINGGFSLTIGQVVGDDLQLHLKSQRESGNFPNTYFSTSLVGLQYDLHYNIIYREGFRLYGSAGFGLLRFRAYDATGNALAPQASLRNSNEDYSNVTGMFPLGFGAMAFLPNGFGLKADVKWINPFTDYIDNISERGTQSGADQLLTYQIALLIPPRTLTQIIMGRPNLSNPRRFIHL